MREKLLHDKEKIKKLLQENGECTLIRITDGKKRKIILKCKCGNIVEKFLSQCVVCSKENIPIMCNQCCVEYKKEKMRKSTDELVIYFEKYKNVKFLSRDKDIVTVQCKCGTIIKGTFRSMSGKPNYQCCNCSKIGKKEILLKRLEDRINTLIEENNLPVEEVFIDQNAHKTKLKVRCSNCNQSFIATYNYIFRDEGCLCNKCIMKNIIQLTSLDFNRIINRCRDLDYSLITKENEYVNSSSILNVICNKHPNKIITTKWVNLAYGEVCKLCTSNSFLLERTVKKILENNFIPYYPQYTNDLCKNINKLRFDFGIYSDNEHTNLIALIETNGRQHYRPATFGGISEERAKENFKKQLENDNIKRTFCKNNNIPLLELRYDEISNYEKIILEFLEGRG